MTRNLIYCGGAAVVLVLGLFAIIWPFGHSSVVPDEQLQEFVYVDTKTGDAFLLRARSSPEYNPVTGDPTLIPGLYCLKCGAWKAVGPLEMLQTTQAPHLCPIHKIALTLDGPLPEALE